MIWLHLFWFCEHKHKLKTKKSWVHLWQGLSPLYLMIDHDLNHDGNLISFVLVTWRKKHKRNVVHLWQGTQDHHHHCNDGLQWRFDYSCHGMVKKKLNFYQKILKLVSVCVGGGVFRSSSQRLRIIRVSVNYNIFTKNFKRMKSITWLTIQPIWPEMV